MNQNSYESEVIYCSLYIPFVGLCITLGYDPWQNFEVPLHCTCMTDTVNIIQCELKHFIILTREIYYQHSIDMADPNGSGICTVKTVRHDIQVN